MRTIAQQYFNANFKADTSFGTPGTISMVIANSSVTLSVTDNLPTSLLSVAGITSVPVTATNAVVWGQTKLWVSLVLDNTGSMCEPDSNPCPGDTNANIKINALKTASHQLLGILQNAAPAPRATFRSRSCPLPKTSISGTGFLGERRSTGPIGSRRRRHRKMPCPARR